MTEICPECDEEFERLGYHWRFSPDHRPDFTEEQYDIISGILMGDAWLDRQPKNPYIEIFNTNKKYLEYLSEKFGILSQDVKLKNTSEELLERDSKKNNRFSTSEDSERKPVYRLRSKCHPNLSVYRSWYKNKQKRFARVVLSPTVFKHWYFCDGTYVEDSHRLKIALSNEGDRKQFVEELFISAGLPEPSWEQAERKDGSMRYGIWFRQDETDNLFKYMGEPCPGFEYKWPDEYKS